jgi:hypothetical protein
MNGELIGHVGVDSGQIMIGDPCYLRQWGGHDFTSFGSEYEPSGEYSYDGACLATLSDKGAGELGNGLAIATQTGYGDGNYPVYVERTAEGRIASVTIVFSESDDEDDSDEYYDDEDSSLD